MTLLFFMDSSPVIMVFLFDKAHIPDKNLKIIPEFLASIIFDFGVMFPFFPFMSR